MPVRATDCSLVLYGHGLSHYGWALAIDGMQDQLPLEDSSKEVDCRIGWTLLELRLRP